MNGNKIVPSQLNFDNKTGKFIHYASGDTAIDEYKAVSVLINRPFNEFCVEVIASGNYKDCLGSGWYHTINLVRVKDQYFAPEMECAH